VLFTSCKIFYQYQNAQEEYCAYKNTHTMNLLHSIHILDKCKQEILVYAIMNVLYVLIRFDKLFKVQVKRCEASFHQATRDKSVPVVF